MTVKQLLSTAGVKALFPYNSLFDNWVISLKRAENRGLKAQAMRIGNKRIVIALQAKVPTKHVWLPLLATSVSVLSVAMYSLGNTGQSRKYPVIENSCQPFSVGESIRFSHGESSLRDWKLSMQVLHELGNLKQIRVYATCKNKMWNGIFLVNQNNGMIFLKKLAPTK